MVEMSKNFGLELPEGLTYLLRRANKQIVNLQKYNQKFAALRKRNSRKPKTKPDPQRSSPGLNAVKLPGIFIHPDRLPLASWQLPASQNPPPLGDKLEVHQ